MRPAIGRKPEEYRSQTLLSSLPLIICQNIRVIKPEDRGQGEQVDDTHTGLPTRQRGWGGGLDLRGTLALSTLLNLQTLQLDTARWLVQPHSPKPWSKDQHISSGEWSHVNFQELKCPYSTSLAITFPNCNFVLQLQEIQGSRKAYYSSFLQSHMLPPSQIRALG